MARRAWGIDLGRSAVKGALLELTDEGVQILAADIVPLEGVPPDPSQDPTRDARLWRALRTFHEKHHLDKVPVCVAIPAQNTFMRELSVASLGRRKLDEMVRYEASNEIPFVLDEVVWDYALFPEKPDEATRKGLLMAVKKNAILTYVQVLAQLGMGPLVLITLSPLALLNFLRLELGEDARVLALDIGGENTNLLALDAGRFWIRNMLAGGNRVTALLQEEFHIEFDQAQKAKENIAQARYAQQILSASLPAVHELMRDLKTNLTYLDRVTPVSGFGATYAFGGGAKLPGLKKQLSATLRQEMQEVKELQHVVVAAGADVAFVRSNLDRLAVAIGAALGGLGKGAVNVSFVPKEDSASARISRAKRLAFAAGIAVWAVMLTLYFFALKVHKGVEVPLANYRKLASIAGAKEHDLAQALDRKAQEVGLQSLLSAARAKGQAAAILDGVVVAFAAANRASPFRFQIYAFSCRQAPTVGTLPVVAPAPAALSAPGTVPARQPAASQDDDWFVGSLRGRIMLPRGATASAAYRRFLDDLLTNLRVSPALAKATGEATFHKDQGTVTSENANWEDVVQRGDQITTLPDRKVYTIAAVTSPTELLLGPPLPGEDFTGKYTIARVLPMGFNEDVLEFTVRFEVPRAAALDLQALTAPKKPE